MKNRICQSRFVSFCSHQYCSHQSVVCAMKPSQRPPFSSLPLRPEDPPYSAWNLYGPKDELGTLNLLTRERVLAAAKEIQLGESFGLNLPLNQPDPPSHNRMGFTHKITHKSPRNVHDDVIEMNTQVSTLSGVFKPLPVLALTRQGSVQHNGMVSVTMATKICRSATTASPFQRSRAQMRAMYLEPEVSRGFSAQPITKSCASDTNVD